MRVGFSCEGWDGRARARGVQERFYGGPWPLIFFIFFFFFFPLSRWENEKEKEYEKEWIASLKIPLLGQKVNRAATQKAARFQPNNTNT
jgi:hypothetical protein